MNLTCRFSLVGNGEPLIHASNAAERRGLNLSSSYRVVVGNILIEDFNVHVISDVLDIDVVGLIPPRRLARVLFDSCLESLLSILNNTEGVHFTKELCVTGEFGLDNSQAKTS